MKRTRAFTCALALLLIGGAAFAAPGIRQGIPGPYGSIPAKFEDFAVIVEPEEDAAEWWAGAPSVVRDEDGVFWLACRMRTPELPRGLRGYELRILRSEDGVNFEHVKSIFREDIPIATFERPALAIDPDTGHFKLYACSPWPDTDGVWSIVKFDDVADPADFDPSTARPVIQPLPMAYPRDIRPEGYKDPVVIYAEGAWHCYVIGQIRRTERIYHFTSADGENWEPVGSHYDDILDAKGWHNFYIRPSSVVPLGIGYLFVYEGSSAAWHDPVYNMGTGLAFTFDLHNLVNITTEGPLAISSTPSENFHVFRYSDWLLVDDMWYIYAEVAKPNEAHELRLFRVAR